MQNLLSPKSPIVATKEIGQGLNYNKIFVVKEFQAYLPG